ncbi:uncharacterized protein LOC131243267 isoform X3 [Magnolia sinica]|uniref:uncharacterized protein LOC131243267 isoform X3 n=1 Tax=Magnolia sinica TaxID=86752 RepID=UPI002657C863|nr:uncharacterized protein LOC131243267 isoform X3 [Magnolia sinica]
MSPLKHSTCCDFASHLICIVKDLLELYAKEHHILGMNKPQQLRELEIFVSFKVGATSMTVLRSLWQAYGSMSTGEVQIMPWPIGSMSTGEVQNIQKVCLSSLTLCHAAHCQTCWEQNSSSARACI